jgi:hypothetical protein
MKATESKQARALRLLEQLRPEILKNFLVSPEYGFSSLTVHFYEGEVTRLIHTFEESVIPPVKNEYPKSTASN